VCNVSFTVRVVLCSVFCLSMMCYLCDSGTVVVQALCYKPEGRGFDTRSGDSRKSRIRQWRSFALAMRQQKLAITLPTSGGRSVGNLRLRTKATELFK
jgi:hypothetical protein